MRRHVSGAILGERGIARSSAATYFATYEARLLPIFATYASYSGGHQRTINALLALNSPGFPVF